MAMPPPVDRAGPLIDPSSSAGSKPSAQKRLREKQHGWFTAEAVLQCKKIHKIPESRGSFSNQFSSRPQSTSGQEAAGLGLGHPLSLH